PGGGGNNQPELGYPLSFYFVINCFVDFLQRMEMKLVEFDQRFELKLQHQEKESVVVLVVIV
ncbi:MAG: hypothetical protein MK076_08845, partial [Flavobacteriales bacterium]|nr:hypothetical protein [Flavobacteriales bacterium]